MQFYRRLTPFKLLSFDLDDTVYSNHPQMIKAEQAMQQYFADRFDQAAELPKQFWRDHRQQALRQQPELRHDVTKLRTLSYQLALQQLGLSTTQAKQQAIAAVEHFLYHRSNFTVATETVELLQQLAKHLPLVAISNGNVDIQRIGLSNIFSAHYHPGKGYKSKPSVDMFSAVAQQFNLPTSAILHIGDCGHADVYGALSAGCQVAWYTRYTIGKPAKLLPHFQFADLTHLTQLI
jgi:putative hydrolase of the HAD superfamily